MRLAKKFFIPLADSPEQEQRVYGAIKKHLGTLLGAEFSERRIRFLRWKHDGKNYTAEVGNVTSANEGLVIAILYEPKRKLYHVCTPTRGVAEGMSILAGGDFVIDCEDFDE